MGRYVGMFLWLLFWPVILIARVVPSLDRYDRRRRRDMRGRWL
jgi:hypothetical protein